MAIVQDPTGAPFLAAVERLFPGGRVVSWEPLGEDSGAGVSRKGAGYGQPLRIVVEDAGGERRTVVFRTASPNEFGHDRRADRADELLLAFDTFGRVPDHVRALDVGFITPDGPRSAGGAGEPYLVTTYAEGRLYADDLRRIAHDRRATGLDEARCEALACWLVALHRERYRDPVAWRRALRDLVGHGEGVFGVVDAYPPDTPGAPSERLARIEHLCVDWRWRLRQREERLCRTHGDFHPFNILFSEGTRFTVLDASRGGRGDPADDLTALSINYLFFALQAPDAWAPALRPLWARFWTVYLANALDQEVLLAAPPFLAWRALVLACPKFYPDLPPPGREALLDLAERTLRAGRLDPAAVDEVLA